MICRPLYYRDAPSIAFVDRRRRLQTMVHRIRRPFVLCTHHKAGTTLVGSVMSDVAAELGLRFRVAHPETGTYLPKRADVVHHLHSRIPSDALPKGVRGVHVIRDPREVVVSGYLYHLRTDEAWCTNDDFRVVGPIGFPQVPFERLTDTEEEKAAYLERLGGRSYRENLRSRSREEGLVFEMDGYAGRTIRDMLAWLPGRPGFLELKLEEIMADYDAAWERIFGHMGLSGNALHRALAVARSHDLSRQSAESVEKNPHVSSTRFRPDKWQEEFTPAVRKAYEKRFDGAHEQLGYSAGA